MSGPASRHTAIARHAVPQDGSVARETVSRYTPIFSTADYIYVALPITDEQGPRTSVAKLDRDYNAVEVVGLHNIPHDGINAAHRSASVAVTSAGTVLAYPAGHIQPWSAYASSEPESLAHLERVGHAAPDSLGRTDYRRFWHDPHAGRTYLTFRGPSGPYDFYAYHWNEQARQFEPVGGTVPGYTFDDLEPGTYEVRVRQVNNEGAGPWSDQASYVVKP